MVSRDKLQVFLRARPPKRTSLGPQTQEHNKPLVRRMHGGAVVVIGMTFVEEQHEERLRSRPLDNVQKKLGCGRDGRGMYRDENQAQQSRNYYQRKKCTFLRSFLKRTTT
ncbi:4148_t:CDS:2 [Paraglomus brasilianum]|uniref:4148_t:CDS:1 n=1 Tax=Paraglomus brasilianum TaxID=144538 RepID=A0A9N9C236_9GLOM|nr:4148_t:CDS:2 [Paraglomus brasilianum]